MRASRSTLALALAGCLLPGPGRAEEPRALEPVVVTATKIEEPAERLGATVTVLTEEDLAAFRRESAGAALRPVPGVLIQQSGGPGKTTAIRIRGASPQQVQVLVDGVRVKSPTTGLAELADIDLEQVERIEIVRGPQSTLHGADAIGGVVHIITKRGRGPLSAYASAEVGNRDTFRWRAGLSGSAGPFDYALGGSWFESDGQVPNDATRQRAFSSRLGLSLPADGHLGLSLRYARVATELPFDGLTPVPTPPFFVLDPNAEQLSETVTLGLQWTQRPVEWLEVRARYGRFWNWLTFRDPATAADAAAGNLDLLFGELRSRIDVERREAELVTAWHAGRWNTLTLGAEYQHEAGENRSSSGGFPTRFEERLATVSWFVQDELRLFDRVILAGGRRWDDHSAFGAVATHRASLVVLLRETGTKLRGSWAEGFRAPTINDLFFPSFANPDLRPERSESWDAGLDQRLWRDRVRLGVTYFDNWFRDLIQITFDASQCPPGNPFGCPVNVGRARTRGVETSLAVDLPGRVTLSGAYTFTEAEDLRTRRPLRRWPRHRYSAGLTWEPVRALSLFAEALVVSSQPDQATDPATFAALDVRNPGYHRLDVGGRYRLFERRGAWPSLDFTARISNLTDQRIMEVFGFPAPGIQALVGLEARR